MSWALHFLGRRGAVRREVLAATSPNEADALHLAAVRPVLLSVIDGNTAVALNFSASGWRDTAGTEVLAVDVQPLAGFVE